MPGRRLCPFRWPLWHLFATEMLNSLPSVWEIFMRNYGEAELNSHALFSNKGNKIPRKASNLLKIAQKLMTETEPGFYLLSLTHLYSSIPPPLWELGNSRLVSISWGLSSGDAIPGGWEKAGSNWPRPREAWHRLTWTQSQAEPNPN